MTKPVSNTFIPLPQSTQLPSEKASSITFGPTVNIQTVKLAPQHPVADIIHAAARLAMCMASAIGTAMLSFVIAKHTYVTGTEGRIQEALRTIVSQSIGPLQ